MGRSLPHDMGQRNRDKLGSMLSIVIPTSESERALVRTLACLVPGAMAGLVREVILADAGSRDETAEVGDIAGCRLLPLPGPLGTRLAFAASSARGEWLLFLRPGIVLEADWVAEVSQFIDSAQPDVAATFRLAPRPSAPTSLLADMAAVWRTRRARPGPERGLLIAKALYREIGDHRDGKDTEAEFFVRIGKRRLVTLRSGITLPATGGRPILDSVK